MWCNDPQDMLQQFCSNAFFFSSKNSSENNSSENNSSPSLMLCDLLLVTVHIDKQSHDLPKHKIIHMSSCPPLVPMDLVIPVPLSMGTYMTSFINKCDL